MIFIAGAISHLKKYAHVKSGNLFTDYFWGIQIKKMIGNHQLVYHLAK